jgi:hypothetical protein
MTKVIVTHRNLSNVPKVFQNSKEQLSNIFYLGNGSRCTKRFHVKVIILYIIREFLLLSFHV